MKTNSSPSPGGNTAKTSTCDVLSAYYARAKTALQCPPINDTTPPAPPSTPPPSNGLASSPATSSPSAPEALRFAGVTASAYEKPRRSGSLRLPWWWTLIAIIASSAGAHRLTRPNSRLPETTQANSATAPTASSTPSPQIGSLHRFRDGPGLILALPNQGLYLLNQQADGTLLVKTKNGLEPLIPFTEPVR